MGFNIVVRVLEKIVAAKMQSMSSIKVLLERRVNTIISGKYPSKVQVNIRRNVMAAFLLRGVYDEEEWEVVDSTDVVCCNTARLLAVIKIGMLMMKQVMNNVTKKVKNPTASHWFVSVEALSRRRK